jgi:acetyl-CoA C-acetyltransferase
VPCTTVNKMCGSGMKTGMMAFEALHVRPKDVIVAGGLESMTNTPHILPKLRSGQRLGHTQIYDHMFLDGLEDAYDKGRLMGTYAEDTAQHYQFTREQQDAYAVESLVRAKRANEDGSFAKEIAPVKVKGRKGDVVVDRDEQPFSADPSKIPTLKPAFREGGTVTPANSSSISDGAAALILMRESEAKRRGLKPLAKIVATSSQAQEPAWFTTAPIGAIKKVLDMTGWTTKDVGLYEINEAFAVVTMAAMRDLDLPHDKVNVHGGACALGHPVGASGARIIVTLMNAMEKRGEKKGIASLCIGGGEATAVAIERLS